MKARRPLTLVEFNKIKQLQKQGLSTYKTAKEVNRFPSTIWEIYQAKDMAEYRKFQKEVRQRYYNPKPGARQGTVFNHILERLDAIDKNVETIKQDLALVPKRRKY